MKGKLLFQDLGEERLLCLQVLRNRRFGGSIKPGDYHPMISFTYDVAERELKSNLSKLYNTKKFDNYDPNTCWTNGPFAVRSDRVLREVIDSKIAKINSPYEIEHNFFYSTKLGGLKPEGLEILANENGLDFNSNTDVEQLIEVANSYQAFRIPKYGGVEELTMMQKVNRDLTLSKQAQARRRLSADECYQRFEKILSENQSIQLQLNYNVDYNVETEPIGGVTLSP